MFSNLNFRGFKCFGFDIFPLCLIFRHVVFWYFCYQDLFQSCFSHRAYNPGLSIWLSSTSLWKEARLLVQEVRKARAERNEEVGKQIALQLGKRSRARKIQLLAKDPCTLILVFYLSDFSNYYDYYSSSSSHHRPRHHHHPLSSSSLSLSTIIIIINIGSFAKAVNVWSCSWVLAFLFWIA